nr:hypothetical protein [Tanacetum cinerariifolium]
RPSPTVESTSAEGQNKHSTTAENGESTDSILSKPTVKFVKASDKPAERPTTNKAEFVKAAERPTTDKVETAKKPAVRYAKMYKRTSKRSTVRGNQRNWNNFKSYQLGPEFVLHKKPCFNCGDFSHLAIDYRRRIQRETTSKSQSFLEGGTYGVEEEGFCTSPELIVAGVISLSAGPELLCSETMTVSSSKSTWMVSTIRLTGLPEFADDIVTDYSRPSPTVETERPTTDKVETAKKPAVRYAEMYRRTSKRSNVRGN